MDPVKLEAMMLGEEENMMKFIQDFQNRWCEETGTAWNLNETESE